MSTPLRYCLSASLVALTVALAAETALAAAIPTGRYEGKTEGNRAVSLRVTSGSQEVRDFRAAVPAPGCGGAAATVALRRMTIRGDRFSSTVKIPVSQGMETVQVAGRLRRNKATGVMTVTFIGEAACSVKVNFTASATRTVSERSSGRTVRLGSGMLLIVRLHGNFASTGYHWEVTRPPDRRVLRLSSRITQTPSLCPPPTVGCAGLDVLRYQARHAGRTSLSIKLFPPGSDRAVKTLRLTIIVG